MGDSGPPPHKKWPFFAQKWPKNANFGGKKSDFWAWVVSTSPPYPISQMPDAKKHVFQIIGASK